jgi:hypothetical protein
MFGTALYGTTIWGGIRVTPATPSTPEPPEPEPVFLGLHIWIGAGGGVDYSDDLLVSTLHVKDEINARSSAEFSIKDEQNVYRFSCGQPVRIMNDTALIFSGIVDEVEEELTGRGLGNCMIHHVSCTDWTSLADRHFVTQRYDSTTQTVYSVVKLILDTDSGMGNPDKCLGDNGIIMDPNMDQSTLLGTCTFDHVPCSEAFDQIAEKTGFWWRIESISYNPTTHAETKYLRFYELSKNPAPYELNPDVWGDWRNLSIRRQQEKYRNVQYLRAGNATTSELVTDKFKGKATTGTDKSEMIYTLRYPVAVKAKPEIWVNSAQVPAANVDIRADEGEQDGIDYFYQVGSKEITQNNRAGFDALITTDVLEVKYYGLFPILVQATDDKEIEARADLEDGVGVYCDIESDDSIDDIDMALERAYGLLRTYGRAPAKLSVETDTNGFRAGQVLTVNLASHGISGQFLIQSVSFRSVAEKFFRYAIEGTEGDGEGSWVDFWRRLAQRTRPPVIGDNETLYMVKQPKDGIILGESISTTEALAAYTTDVYTYAMIGGYCLGKITTDNKVHGPIMGTPYGAGT